ncbi:MULTISPECIES: hypothetical protein [unclassified Nostoc]|uniref:hypothetical protein n=1 Tax=unclassified Nostoc TaxID=2593658 RepID=UPI002AD20D78|nr:hypothetical protein [Nostoc sp. ChiQUE02]MDZ8235248.1 hypothetical protein [Nostoc sp. ChiQUE02]
MTCPIHQLDWDLLKVSPGVSLVPMQSMGMGEWLIRGSASNQTLSQQPDECILMRSIGTRKGLYLNQTRILGLVCTP